MAPEPLWGEAEIIIETMLGSLERRSFVSESAPGLALTPAAVAGRFAIHHIRSALSVVEGLTWENAKSCALFLAARADWSGPAQPIRDLENHRAELRDEAMRRFGGYPAPFDAPPDRVVDRPEPGFLPAAELLEGRLM